MNLDNLTQRVETFCNALSELDDALTDTQMNFVMGGSESDVRIQRLIHEVESNVSGFDQKAVQITEQMELLNQLNAVNNVPERT